MIPKYYEFLNKTKILSGYQALENIPHELETRHVRRPVIITEKEAVEQGILKTFLSAQNGSNLIIGCIYELEKNPDEDYTEKAIGEFKENSCDSIIAIGGGNAFELGRTISLILSQHNEEDLLLMGTDYARNSPVPFIVIPIASSGLKLTGDPDVLVLDSRMTINLAPKNIVLSAIDSLCHAIETYTCLQKNPLSDAYAFSAISLIRENLAEAFKHPWDKKVRHAMANAAILSSIALKNSQAGITHAMADALFESNNISHEEAVGIILPYCMDINLLKLGDRYGELLFPLSGPDIFADTPSHERGRKTVQEIRDIIAEYHQKGGIPNCLSEVGVKRSDFDNIIVYCMKNSQMLYNPQDVTEEDIRNILNMSF